MLNYLPESAKVVVIGASRGIGLEFVRQFAALDNVSHVIAGVRSPQQAAAVVTAISTKVSVEQVDVCDDTSVAALAALSMTDGIRPSIIINTAGLLHEGAVAPEKRLEDINAEALTKSFAVNAIGCALVAKHFVPAMNRSHPAVFATLSARVGSISDNRLGGWYAYRASKAAQNMLTKNIAIEAKRRTPNLVVVGLHPGTVDTDLSLPFQANVKPEKLFSTTQSVTQLMSVLNTIDSESSGKILAWDGSEIDP